jgi:carbonic anhydrase
MTLSAEQIAAYTAIYDDTSRPVQPLNGRTVLQATAGS